VVGRVIILLLLPCPIQIEPMDRLWAVRKSVAEKSNELKEASLHKDDDLPNLEECSSNGEFVPLIDCLTMKPIVDTMPREKDFLNTSPSNSAMVREMPEKQQAQQCHEMNELEPETQTTLSNLGEKTTTNFMENPLAVKKMREPSKELLIAINSIQNGPTKTVVPNFSPNRDSVMDVSWLLSSSNSNSNSNSNRNSDMANFPMNFPLVERKFASNKDPPTNELSNSRNLPSLSHPNESGKEESMDQSRTISLHENRNSNPSQPIWSEDKYKTPVRKSRFCLVVQPLPKQRKAYKSENMCLLPNPLVIRRIQDDESPIFMGRVTVTLISFDRSRLNSDKGAGLISVGEEGLSRQLTANNTAVFSLKIIETSDTFQFRLLFTIEYKVRHRTGFCVEKILSNSFVVRSNTTKYKARRE